MIGRPQPPMTQEHAAILQRAQERHELNSKLIEKCEACGLDTQEVQQIHAQQGELIKAIKHNFFPDMDW